MSISVLGAGAFGTALAISLAGKGPVTLWARDPSDMQTRRENTKRLPGCPFPDPLNVTDNLAQACAADILLVAIPLQKLRAFLHKNRAYVGQKTLVACCKGIELNTGSGPVSVILSAVPNAIPAILTGPSFAADIARGLPTALTLACADDDRGQALQQALTTENLRLYRTTDTIGAELGGALKNVIAIACGTAMGAGLGESARAALMTRGFAEMQRLAAHLHADPRTLAGLAGFGDLTLTCTSTQSRNYRLGLALGDGSDFDATTTVEGAATARAVDALATKAELELPITAAVAGLLDGRLDVPSAMNALLTRPLKKNDMFIALIAHDKPGALDVRTANRPAHLDYLKSTDLVAQAGPLLDAEGGMIGSLIILDVPDMATAQNWAENDPYAIAGLFQSVTLTHWNRVIG